METSVVISRQPEIKSLVRVSRYILLRMPFVKIVAVFAVFIFATTLLGQITRTNPTLDWQDWVSYFSVVLIWTFILVGVDYSIRKSITKNPKALEPQTLTLTSSGLTSEGQTYKVDYPWESIQKIKETHRWFLIFVNKTSALPIEKANLTNREYGQLKKLFNSLNVKKQLLA